MLDQTKIDNHLSREEFLAYYEQRLTSAEMNRIERHLLECSFCDDALNGIVSSDNAIKTVDTLRLLRKKGRKKFSSKYKFFQLIDINTVLVLLFIIGILIFFSLYLIKSSH